MGGKSSSSSSAQNTTNNDNRQVNSWTIDDRDTSTSYDLSDRSVYQDQSIRIDDSSDRSTKLNVSDSRQWYSSVSDSSQRNTNTYTFTGSDAEAINRQNTEFLRDASDNLTDGIRVIAGFGDDALRRMGESATSLYATAGNNAVRQFEAGTKASTDAWAATVERSTGLIDSLLKGANNTVNAARDISQQAITSFQPTENKAADVGKWGLIAAAAVAGVYLLSKKG